MGTLSFPKVEMPFWASFKASVWGVETMRAPNRSFSIPARGPAYWRGDGGRGGSNARQDADRRDGGGGKLTVENDLL